MDDLPHDTDLFGDSLFTARLASVAPRTLVNSIPMEGTAFIAPFVPCTEEVARAAIGFAEVDLSLDVLCDLGCGDGRVLVQALTSLPHNEPHVQRKVVGVELDPHLAEHLRTAVAAQFEMGVLTVVEGNMFEVDLDALGVDVMVLYLLPEGLGKLRGLLKTWLERPDVKRKRRIVTITYSIPGWNCDRAKEISRQWLFYYDATDIRE